MNVDVFISYSSRNKAVADAICAGLEAERIRCWIAPRDVLPGQNYGESIIQGLSTCKVVVLVFSQESNLSQAVMREMERAMHHAKPIIPFRLEDIPMSQGLQFFLASCHWLDALSPPLEKHIAHLTKAVKALLDQPVQPDGAAGPPVPPPAPVTRDRRLWLVVPGLLLAGLIVAWFAWSRWPAAPGPAVGTAPTEPAAREGPGISCDLTLAPGRGEAIRDHFRGLGQATVRYRSQAEGGVLRVTAESPYLSAWEGNEPLKALRADHGRFFSDSALPLEIKLLNTGKTTAFFHRLVAEVQFSRSQAKPLLVLETTATGPVRIVNVGAPVREPVKIRLALAGPEDALDDGKLPPPAEVPLVDGVALVPLPGRNPSLEQTAYGELILGARIRRFELALGGRRQSPAAVPGTRDSSGGQTITLRAASDTYEAECPLSQYLKPNEGDVVSVRVSAEETSAHRFRFRLEYDDGSGGGVKSIFSSWIDAELFHPKGG